ncbi:MAG TPA: hypothetical protein VF773_04640 [Verrucomicrobiae bacterium]
MSSHRINVAVSARHSSAAVEDKGRSIGAGKLSFEVLESNHRARKTYAAAGFSSNSDEVLTLYITKKL